MHKPLILPLPASILSLIVFLHAGSACAKGGYKRAPQATIKQSKSPVETIVIDQSSFAVNPTNIVINTTTIVPTLPAVTIDHAAISIDKSNNVFINGSEAVTYAPPSAQTSTPQNPSNLTKTYSGYGSSRPSGSSGLSESSAVFPSNSGFQSASNVSSTFSSVLASSGTPSAPSSSNSLPAGPGPSLTSSGYDRISRSSTHSDLRAPSGNSSQSIPTNIPNSSGTLLGTGASLSSTSASASRSQEASGPILNSTNTYASQSQSGSQRSSTQATPRSATISITSFAGKGAAPGSTGSLSGPSTTSGSAGASAPSVSSTGTSESSSTVSYDVPNTTQPGGIPITSLSNNGAAKSSQRSVLGGILLGFVSDGRNWVSEVTLPAIKTQAINEIENLQSNTENVIKNLGGPFPPTSNACSSGASRKRGVDLIGAIEGLASDALGLANCVDNIINDMSNEVGPITGPPPQSDVIASISTQLDALEKAGEEEKENDDQSTQDTSSNTKGSTSTSPGSSSSSASSPMSSSGSSASSVKSTASQSSSQTSSAASSCPSYVYPDDDIEEWEGTSNNKRAIDVGGRPYKESQDIGGDNRKTEESLHRQHELRKRDPSSITKINTCTFPDKGQAVQPGYSQLKGFKALYKQMTGQGGRNGIVYNAASKWYVGIKDCSSPSGFSAYKTADGVEPPTDIPKESQQSIDHVYELSLVEAFLTTVIGTSSFTCEDMNEVFFNGCGSTSLMQTVFNQLPGMQFSDDLKHNPPLYTNINNGFIGLEQSVNGVKGYMFGKSLSADSEMFSSKRLTNNLSKIGTIQDLIMLFTFIRMGQVANMFDVTNDRIYKAYQTIDARITSQKLQKSDNSGPIAANFASTYKTWMTQYLADIANLAWEWASETVTTLDASLVGKTDEDSVSQMSLLNKIKASADFSEDKFTIDWTLSWSTGTVTKRNLFGRQEDSSNSTDAVCGYTPSGTASSQSSTISSSASKAASTSTASLTSTSNITPRSTLSTISRPRSTTLSAAPTVTSSPAASATFSCSLNPSPVPGYPCLCNGLKYCALNGGCNWTTEPTAENCCEDCG